MVIIYLLYLYLPIFIKNKLKKLLWNIKTINQNKLFLKSDLFLCILGPFTLKPEKKKNLSFSLTNIYFFFLKIQSFAELICSFFYCILSYRILFRHNHFSKILLYTHEQSQFICMMVIVHLLITNKK